MKRLRFSAYCQPQVLHGKQRLCPANMQGGSDRVACLHGLLEYLNEVLQGATDPALARAAMSRIPMADDLVELVEADGRLHCRPRSGAEAKIGFQASALGIAFADGRSRGRSGQAYVATGEATATVATLCRDLMRGIALGEVTQRFGRPYTALVETLTQRGIVEPVGDDDLGPPPSARGDRVTWLGHAAAVVETADACVWIDPCLPPRLRFGAADRRLFSPEHADSELMADYGPHVEPSCARELPRPDAVLITHQDVDHFDLGALMAVPPSVPIVVPVADPMRPWEVDLGRFLTTVLGPDQRVVRLAHGESLQVGSLSVTALPFRGEMPASLPHAWNTYLVESPQSRVVFTADARMDDAFVDALAIRFEARPKPMILFAGPPHSRMTMPGWREGPSTTRLWNSDRLWGWYVTPAALFAPVACSKVTYAQLEALGQRAGLKAYFPYAVGNVPWFRIDDPDDAFYVPVSSQRRADLCAIRVRLAALTPAIELLEARYAEPVRSSGPKPHRGNEEQNGRSSELHDVEPERAARRAELIGYARAPRPQDLERIVEHVDAAPTLVRAAATLALRALASQRPEHADALFRAGLQGTRDVASEIAGALVLTGEHGLDHLVHALEQPAERAYAVQCLGAWTRLPSSVHSALAGCLTDGDPVTRIRAARALGTATCEASGDALRQRLADADLRVRLSAAGSLAHRDDPTAVGLLATEAQRPGSAARVAACTLLVRAGARAMAEHADVLLALAGDPDPAVRSPALTGLGSAASCVSVARRDRIVALMLERLGADTVDERAAAATALGHIGPAAGDVAVSALIEAVLERDPVTDFFVHIPVVLALVRFGDHGLPAVRQALRSSAHAATRGAMATVLGELGARAIEARVELEAGLRDDDVFVTIRCAAALAAVTGHAEPGLGILQAKAEHADTAVRRQALFVLGRMPQHFGAAILPAIAGALADLDAPVRGQAAESLGRWGAAAQAHLPGLWSLAHDRDAFVAARAMQSIDDIRHRRARRRLQRIPTSAGVRRKEAS